ncbi:tRNA (adenine22-N1)-methyltransferase [Salsuginibacillus halophilus]|uniref:tRNA (Adenine22-N1)-methyltransferase n=1 Tax=Salsuginibacillus halophilus TaxID=517424 RepID=A0A2P8HFL4_9BACI|nr:tRNA (adenine(22)-N(1))-methyltransferase TrmK [Salsuginibacillus halophilus]PSL45007.1 tRNA (adenine22-N1)-methyltransferase [Salsuginibacillus halophilus]
MGDIQLSPRLESVASFVHRQKKLLDVGSDHALLPLALHKRGQIDEAVAGEVNQGPFEAAVKNIDAYGAASTITARHGDGLFVLHAEEAVDVVTICGMGGELIARLLTEGKSRLSGKERLVLQPNMAAASIRRFLIDHGYELVAEDVVQEGHRFYEVLAAESGDPYKPYQDVDRDAALLLGPFLLQQKKTAFIEKWKREYQEWERVLKALEHAADDEAVLQKRDELKRKMNIVEEAVL